jgi:hypothetical protein
MISMLLQILVIMNKPFHNLDRNAGVNTVISMATIYADKAIAKEIYK